MIDPSFTAIIVDDEPNACLNLQAICHTYLEGIQIMGLAGDVNQAKILLAEHPIDIVFLDISMPQMSGFHLVDAIDTEKQALIFVTAHEEYALQAFKAKAWHYLTKPIDIDELIKVIDSVKQRLSLAKIEIKNELQAQVLPTHTDNQLLIYNANGFLLVDMGQIVSLEADGNYCIFTLADKRRIISSKQLGHYEKLLSAKFLRVHRSFILNLEQVKGYLNNEGSEAIMSVGNPIPISRRHIKEFLAVIVPKSKK